ncbi:hypothetical protein BDZ89DRAFT_933988, partial [Hymenopellis radicata]
GRLSNEDLPHRQSLTKLIFQVFGHAYQDIIADLARAIGRIAWTSDVWTRGILQGYMAITAHFLTLEN